LKAARAVTQGRVFAVIQPHRYSRLQHHFDGFCACANDADTVLIAPVYAAGEEPVEGVSSDALVAGMRRGGHRDVRELSALSELPAVLKSEVGEGDLVICLGAGDITKTANALPDLLSGA
jgi:UDP-N-acetylmuramate--alanine ligase